MKFINLFIIILQVCKIFASEFKFIISESKSPDHDDWLAFDNLVMKIFISLLIVTCLLLSGDAIVSYNLTYSTCM